MMDIGRICVKIAGRDAGKKCVVIDVLDGNFVMIDGETRRRKCNILHLEPLDKTADIKKNASHAEVSKAFASLGYGTFAPKTKSKTTARPSKARKSKLAGEAPAKAPAAKTAAKPVAKAPAAKPAVKKSAPPAAKPAEKKA
jgi:large subunit ribosomal protein L14e